MFYHEINVIDDHRNGTAAQAWGGENDGWKMTVGFPTPSDYNGVRKPTMDARLRLWDATGGHNCLNICDFGLDGLSCY